MALGRAAFQQARYLDALQHYRTALNEAEGSALSPEIRGQLLTSIGACLVALSEYKAALAQLLEARPIAVQGGNRDHLAALDSNIASVYLYQGDLENAARIYRRALGWTQGRASPHRPLILANLGAIELRERRYRRALEYETAALRELGDASQERRAGVSDLAGMARLGLRDYSGAQELFERSLALREGGDVSRSLMFLGRAEMERGRPEKALAQFDAAVAAARQRDDRATQWEVLYLRGQCHRRLKQLDIATSDLKDAVDVLEKIRPQLVPTDALRVQFETSHHQVYAALADVLCERGQWADAFHAIEMGRAQSLRALVRSGQENWDHEPTLWKRYADLLARLESTRARSLSTAGADGWVSRLAEEEAEARELEARIRIQDPALGSSVFARAITLSEAQQRLGPNRLLLNFYTSADAAYLWAAVHDDLQCYRLPAQWKVEAERFIKAVQAGGPEQTLAGRRAFRALLGPVDSGLLRRRDWIVAADSELALLPFCALRDPAGRYLIEDHSFTFIPSASVLESLERRPHRSYEADFLGLTDPIVNRADPRGAPACQDCPAGLPRLVASAIEVHRSAKLFPPDRTSLLEGRSASESELRRRARRNYRYWHLSSHVVADRERPSHSFIALTLPEKLTVLDVLGMPVRAQMVVLNGCDSGTGQALPGTGVLGLARAFVAAGADSVCATRWKIPDDSGELVSRLYTHLLKGDCDRAEALRRAQLDMVRARDWRSDPRYWGAYFLFGSPRSS